MRECLLSKPFKMQLKLLVILSAGGLVAMAQTKNIATDLFRAFDLRGQIELFSKSTHITTSTEIDVDECGRGRGD